MESNFTKLATSPDICTKVPYFELEDNQYNDFAYWPVTGQVQCPQWDSNMLANYSLLGRESIQSSDVSLGVLWGRSLIFLRIKFLCLFGLVLHSKFLISWLKIKSMPVNNISETERSTCQFKCVCVSPQMWNTGHFTDGLIFSSHIGPCDNGNTRYWPLCLLHTLGAGDHINQRVGFLCGL